MMKLMNPQGQAVYVNEIIKHGKERWLIQAASGHRQKRKSRTFAQEHQARAWLVRNGYIGKG